MPSYYHKLNNHLNKNVAVSDNGQTVEEQTQLKEDFNQEHNYVGAEYLYLKNKLNSGQIHRNLRENGYKNEYINKYDEIYHIMFALYWVLFVIYVGLCAYRSQFFVHTFVFIIIMIAFPFFINPLTDIVKIAMNDGLDYMNHFSISDPNIAKKGEEWVEDVQKDFYETDSGKDIAKAFKSGSDYASSGSDYASGYIRKSKMTNSERDLEDLLNSLVTPPETPVFLTLSLDVNDILIDISNKSDVLIHRFYIKKEKKEEEETVVDYNPGWEREIVIDTGISIVNDDEDGSYINIPNKSSIKLTLDRDDSLPITYTWTYNKSTKIWTVGLLVVEVKSANGNEIYRWEKQADNSWVKKIS